MIKLNIDNYEVEVTARYAILNDKANEYDTATFLNQIIFLARECAERMEEQGYKGIAAEANTWANDIHAALADAGVYDRMREL